MTDTPPRRNIKLVIAYNGAAYHGWQRQSDGIDTVQQRVEEAASRIIGHPVVVFGTGRTDAGVHAAGQVANFYTQNLRIPLKGLRRAMNSALRRDITIRSAQQVDDQFHASRWAVGKTYLYRIYVGPIRPVMLDKQVYHYWMSLGLEQMRAAGQRILGKHDFLAFATSSEQRQNTVRTVYRCDLAQVGSEIHISVTGDGFLYNMVRNIVGTLIEVGRGRWAPQRIDKILASRDRSNAGPTAPPDGLYLQCVYYRDEDLPGNTNSM